MIEQPVKDEAVKRDPRKETTGWMSMALILFLFPTLFYLCVFFPIWVGWTPRW